MKRALCVLLVAAGVLTGCVAVGVGAGGAAAGGAAVGYYMSALRENLGAPVAEVRAATGAVLDEVCDGVVEEQFEASGEKGEFASRLKDGTSVSVSLEPGPSTDTTHVAIRIGTYGDMARSRTLRDQILSRIGTMRQERASAPK